MKRLVASLAEPFPDRLLQLEAIETPEVIRLAVPLFVFHRLPAWEAGEASRWLPDTD